MTQITVPPFYEYMNPIIKALKQLGGSGTIEEINTLAAEIVGLTDEQLEVLHNPEKSTVTATEYRMAWARSYLKQFGVLENSKRGIWSLTLKGRKIEEVNPDSVKRTVREQQKTKKRQTESE